MQSPHVLIVGGTEGDRHRAARTDVPAGHHVIALDAGTLPFTRVTDGVWPPRLRAILIDGIERAFPDAQVGGTRLVLTQSTYLLQTWIDALEAYEIAQALAAQHPAPPGRQAFLDRLGAEIVESE